MKGWSSGGPYAKVLKGTDGLSAACDWWPQLEGPERGSSGEEVGHKHRHSEGGGGGGEKKRRASTSQHDRRARWESGGEWVRHLTDSVIRENEGKERQG